MSKITLLAVLLFAIFSCASDREIKVLKLGHSQDITHPVHLGMEKMAEELAQLSGGKLTIQIYPASQLGGERECLELLQIGSLAMTKVSAAVMENFAPNFRVLGLPYLFKSDQHAYNVLDGPIGERLLAQGQRYKLHGLCFYDAGSRSFYSTEKAIKIPGDLKGLKIRVMKSNTAVNMVNALGGSPTPISFGELYTALQQGVVDGAENNPPSFFSSKHYEICKYYSLDEHTSVPDVLLISTDWWENLTAQEQGWLKEASKRSVSYQRKVWKESVKESLVAIKKAGVEILYPDKSKFAKQMEPLYDAYKDNKEQYELIHEIKNTKSK